MSASKLQGFAQVDGKRPACYCKELLFGQGGLFLTFVKKKVCFASLAKTAKRQRR